ncbi:TniQ family protein [Lachnospiraceae bacterium JLR.KK009]
MIGFMPEIYPDELVYSWFARYYAHSGHPAYVSALGDLMEKKNTRPDVEFISRINKDAKDIIQKMMPMEEMVLGHTMFPYYRFAGNARISNALWAMSGNGGDAHQLLPVFKGKHGVQARHIKYCPECASESREAYGEAYWDRKATIRNIGICPKHKCRLEETSIEISAKQSPRLYVAEGEIKDTMPELAEDGLGFQLAEYMLEVFQSPIDFKNGVPVGDFLKSRLQGTKYLSARGMQMYISLLLDDIQDFYQGLQGTANGNAGKQDAQYQGITEKHQLQHIFSNKNSDFYKICQLAFFLGISPGELTNPRLPKRTQTELYNEKVAQLYAKGLGCHRIAREVGGSPSTVREANKTKGKKLQGYPAARLGKQAVDWDVMDKEMLPEVGKAINEIYGGGKTRPKRVTGYAVTRHMEWPDRRLQYLPKCRELVEAYYEEFPVYWAREAVWAYKLLLRDKGMEDIHWRDMRVITNLRKDNFEAAFPYLERFADKGTAEDIRGLLPK